MTDAVAVCAFAKGKSRIGWSRWFVKDSIKYCPGMGWALIASGAIFVKRDWSKDRHRITKVFDRIVRDRSPVWLMIFPEGTRATPKKLADSRLGARRGCKHVLPPRSRGFVAAVQGLRNHVSAVYDVTIGYPEGTPSLFAFFSRRAAQIHIDVRRIPVGDLPNDASGLAEWLDGCFRRKDARLDRFQNTGTLDQ
jgi:1-acyl-sn-glycerol-3-phosphate acyltransferase